MEFIKPDRTEEPYLGAACNPPFEAALQKNRVKVSTDTLLLGQIKYGNKVIAQL